MEKLNQEKPSQGVKDQNEGLCPRFHASVYAMCILQGAAGEGSEIAVNSDLWREARKGS